jgi:tetratricopeptide (TPR) repeat protein
MSSTPVAPPPDEAREAQPQRNRDGWWALLLVAATAIAYVPVWRAGYIWDDDAHVTKAGLRSLQGLARIWLEPGATQQYYPLLHTAFWAEHRLWGDAAAGYHLTNILLHAAAACLVVAVVRRLAVPGALLAGLLFALHPVAVESVAWISEQKNTLSAVFYLGAAWVYLGFDRDRRASQYWLALGLFVLALLSKTVTATLPAGLLVVFWWQRGRLGWRRDVRPLLPWLGLGLTGGLFTAWVERVLLGANGTEFALSLLDRCVLAGRVVWFYLGKLAWPADLIFIYPRWAVDATVWWQWLFPLGTLGLVGLFCRVAVTRAGDPVQERAARAPLAGWLFFVGTLFPALGFVNVYPFRYSYVADHFQYLASLGIIVPAASGLSWLLARTPAPAKLAAWVLGAGLAALCTVLTWRQCGMYHDDDTLWRTTRDRNPTCWMAQNFVGKMFASTGHFRESLPYYEEALRLDPNSFEVQYNLSIALRETGRIEEAMAHCERSLQLQPGFPEANYDLGVMLAGLGRPDEAAAHYEQVLRIKPDYVDAHINLGVILVGLGRPQDAIVHYQAALRLKPDSADAHSDFGMALHALGRFPEAVTQFEQATRLNPGSAEIHNNLGVALDHAGRVPDAIAQGEEALRLKPDYPEAHNNLGTALREANRLPEAIQHYEAAIRLRRDYLNAQYNLGLALALAGRPAEAIPHYQEALRLKPDSAEAHGNLANALLALGRNAEAIAHLQRALEIDPNQAVLHYNLALVLRALGRSPEANPHYEQARRLRPDLPPWRN